MGGRRTDFVLTHLPGTPRPLVLLQKRGSGHPVQNAPGSRVRAVRLLRALRPLTSRAAVGWQNQGTEWQEEGHALHPVVSRGGRAKGRDVRGEAG